MHNCPEIGSEDKKTPSEVRHDWSFKKAFCGGSYCADTKTILVGNFSLASAAYRRNVPIKVVVSAPPFHGY